jgi:membrane protein YqaA with SNARE-associated domain
VPEQQSTPPEHRARFGKWRTALIVELAGVGVLVIVAILLLDRYRRGGDIAQMLLDPGLWLVVLVISAIGSLGNLGLYSLGRRGTDEVLERFPRLKGDRWDRIEGWYQRWGARILVLSGVPTLGAALTTAAGAFGVEKGPFLRWVFVGKVLRNWLLLLLLRQTFQFVESEISSILYEAPSWGMLAIELLHNAVA